MNPYQLHLPTGEATNIWACGNCNRITTGIGQKENTQEKAEKCCKPFLCVDCSAELGRYTYCERCSKCDQAKRQADDWAKWLERIEKAVDVTDSYDGALFSDWIAKRNDGYMFDDEAVYAALEEAWEDEADITGDIYQWAFACDVNKKSLDLDHAIEILCDDSYEDMYERLVVPKSLEAAVAEFNAINAEALKVYTPDYSRKVRIGGRFTPEAPIPESAQ